MKFSARPVVMALAASLVLVPTNVYCGDADDPETTHSKQACATAFEQAQTFRTESKLIAARRELAVCAEATCPEFVSTKCLTWLEEVGAQIPSVVISVTGADGSDTTAVRVRLDGELVAENLDGKPLEIDPGQHAFVFEHGGLPPVELAVLAKQGEKSRIVEVSFAQGGASTPDPVGDDGAPGWAMPVMFVGFGLGAVGLGLGAITGGMAASKSSDLEESCPNDQCPRSSTEEDLDAALTLADVSTVGFIVGGVCAAVGVVGLVFAVGGSGTEGDAALRLEPTVGPGGLGLRGRF
ncbi:MAG: hypothetical protein JRI68_17515 [Deltaproteobacteria bacterium]|nr:hypothetical protein [Deltaproteobacteria bacterium]